MGGDTAGDSNHKGKCWIPCTGIGWKGLEDHKRFSGGIHFFFTF